MNSRQALDELNDFLSSNLQPLAKDAPIFHQMSVDTTGVGTYAYHSAPNEKVRIFLIPSLIEKNYIPLTQEIIVQRTRKSKSSTAWYQFTGNFDQLKTLCKKANVLVEDAFLRPNARAMSLEDWENLKVYESTTHSDYAIIRKEIADAAGHVALAKNKENLPIVLIDMATGLGDCLHVTAQKLEKLEKKVIKALGIDIIKANKDNAKIKYESYPYDFEQDDLHDLERIIAENVTNKVTEKHFLLLTCSGGITRKVLDTTYEALQIFQQAYRTKINAFVVGGITEALLTQNVARKIGWESDYSLSPESDLRFKPTYTLIRPKQPVIPKIKSGLLNLSLHANPLEVLESLTNRDEITSIDLGLTYIKAEEVDRILSLMPNLKQIFISGRESCAKQLVSLAKERNILLTEQDSVYISVIHDKKKDDDHLELKKMSKSFFQKFSIVKTFTKKIETLTNEIKQNPEKYEIIVNEESLKDGKTQSSILNLQKLSAAGDDTATYRLALYFENNGLKTEGSPDLEQSLVFWKNLYSKCYPVLDDIVRVETEVEKRKKTVVEKKDKVDSNFSSGSSALFNNQATTMSKNNSTTPTPPIFPTFI